MNKRTATISAILIAATAAAYLRLKQKNYYPVHAGMLAEEVVSQIGEPALKTNEMGMDMWFYGLKNKQEHRGTFGMTQYSFNADCAVIFSPNSRQVLDVDQSSEKEWMISLPKTTPQPASQ